jgi:hypothetical protein
VSGQDRWFAIDHLDVARLLTDWRWLRHGDVKLIARNAFGDLFLCADKGEILQLDVGAGTVTKIADSERQFRELASSGDKDEQWFAKSDDVAAATRGLVPGDSQCIGLYPPLVFAESGSGSSSYVIDIYEHVGFLGDLHRQIAELPDGAKVRLRVKC